MKKSLSEDTVLLCDKEDAQDDLHFMKTLSLHTNLQMVHNIHFVCQKIHIAFCDQRDGLNVLLLFIL